MMILVKIILTLVIKLMIMIMLITKDADDKHNIL